jgi:Methyltransferase domain
MEDRLESLDIYACYKRSKYLSMKSTSYFQVYEECFSKFRNRKVTFVEIGIHHGGSLFMWRDYFGPEARIIGIDINPVAKRWESDGFEIYIGDQGDPRFWDEFFSRVGDVDVILDDGGHTNQHQIVTAHHCIPHIRNQGMLIIEDTVTSYLKLFGNPSRYSFINYAKRMIDRINSRSRNLPPSDPAWAVYSMSVYESMVCFRVDRERCFAARPASNDGISSDAENLWHQAAGIERIIRMQVNLKRRFSYLKRFRPIRVGQRLVFDSVDWLWWRLKSANLKKYFS